MKLFKACCIKLTISGESHMIENGNLKEYVLSLGKELSVLHRFVV